MGQESSQVAGDTRNSNDDITKLESRDEDDHLHRAGDCENKAMGQEALIKCEANAVELPKPRKKQKSSSFSRATQEAAENLTVQHRKRRSHPAETSHLLQSTKSNDISNVQSLKPVKRMKAQLEVRRWQLPSVVSDAKSRYSNWEAAEGASNNAGDPGEDMELDFGREAAANRIKPLKNSRKLQRTPKDAKTDRVKKSKSMPSLDMKNNAMNSNLEYLSRSPQVSTTRSNAILSNLTVDSSKEVSEKLKGNIVGGDSQFRPRQRPRRTPKIISTDIAEAQTGDGRSPSIDTELVGNSLRPEYCISPPAVPVPNPVSVPSQNRRDVFEGDPSYESDVNLPDSALPRKLRDTPAAVMITLGNSQSDAKDMSLTGSALRGGLGSGSNPRIQQLKIYSDMATPQTSSKRKRRLPVDHEIPEENATNLSRKKSRKRTLKPKTPKFTQNSETNVLEVIASKKNQHDASSDVVKSAPKKSKSQPKKDSTKILGRFSAEETAVLDKELLKHREIFNMTEYDQNQLIHGQATSAAEFWNEVCEALPSRPRQAVIKNCRRKYHNYGIRGNWTKEDDQQLRKAYERFPRQWKEIGRSMDRHEEDVRDRWRNYGICGDNQKKSLWTQQEEQGLRLAVEECIQAVKELKAIHATKDPSTQFGKRPDIELVDWFVVSEKLGHTRSRLQCSSKWKQLMKVETSDNDQIPDLDLRHRSWRVRASKTAVMNMSRDDYLDLLLAIQNSQAGKEGTVPWQKIGDMDLKTKWSCMDKKVAWKKLRATVSGNENMKLQDIASQLIDDLPPKDLVDAQFTRESPRQAPHRPALRAALQPISRSRPNQDSGGFRPKNSSGKRSSMDDVDPYLLDQYDEDEFDPDDIGGLHTDSFESFQSHEDMVRGVNGEYDYDNLEDGTIEEEVDGSISDTHNEISESVDFKGSTQQKPSTGGGSLHRSKSRINFKDAPDEDVSEDVNTTPDSDSDGSVVETPVRRRYMMRAGSVDLDGL